MYKLIGPKLILFVPLVLIGILAVAFLPNYYNISRILSFSALIIGESGLSFIPILTLYPKASPSQAALLAIIYFFTIFIICFAASGINNIGWTSDYAFTIKDGEFVVNIISLFAANIFSLLTLILNFKLVYDEELAKNLHLKKQQAGYKDKTRFMPFQRTKAILSQPSSERANKFSGKTQSSKKAEKKESFDDDPFKDDFLRPFEFESDTESSKEDLPEESRGKLYSPTKKVKSKSSDFFVDESEFKNYERSIPDDDFPDLAEASPIKKPEPVLEKPKPIQQSNIFPPSNIKDDLQAIFEQYSSLNAIKKLTAMKSEKLHPKKKVQEKTSEKQSKLSAESSISVKIDGEDIHEATYRQISEEEKLEEIKEKLKVELEGKLQEKLTEEIKKKEEAIQKSEQEKEEIIQSIEKVKEQLKEELKKEITQIQDITTEEEIEHLKDVLNGINKNLKINGVFFTNNLGDIVTEHWNNKQVLHKEETLAIPALVKLVNNQFSKTNQGIMLHMLLESENGTLALAEFENKILTIHTNGTGEAFSGQILRALSEIEES